jgi:hypothetical protein
MPRTDFRPSRAEDQSLRCDFLLDALSNCRRQGGKQLIPIAEQIHAGLMRDMPVDNGHGTRHLLP